MRGGRIRGQGTYGCVFQPGLLCRGADQESIDPTKVGKVTSIEDARNELISARYLQGLPDSSNYTIVAESKSCTPRAKSRQVDEDIELCKFTKDMPLQDATQIIMPWGGIPLSMLNINPHAFDFFRFMEEILAIGTFLVINDLCHFDIYGQNFLFNDNNTPKLIDFGFAFRPSLLKVSDLRTRWRMIVIDNDTETPEVTLMLGAFKGIAPSVLIRELEKSKPTVQALASLCGVIPSEWSADLTRWANESRSFQQGDWLSCWKLYWPGFDAWGIGAVLLEILEIQMAVPAFSESERWKKDGEKVKTVIRGLCEGHPAFRLDAAEALNLFTDGAHPLISRGNDADAGSIGSEWVSQKVAKRPPF